MVQVIDFLETLTTYYRDKGRDLSWRRPEPDGSFDGYKILVSEIMLQQTQVSRVIPKYHHFLAVFPTVQALADAPLPAVLAQWTGLGYNRRAKFLQQTAQKLAAVDQPWRFETLIACPGIGPNTAAAVLAYSYNEPVHFVETNIRTVIIHHFFADKKDISDKEMLSILEQITPQAFKKLSSREFYWAMMDYGTHLKATVGNLNKLSKSYVRQSEFDGSNRQIRGRVIKLLLDGPVLFEEVKAHINDPRLAAIVSQLEEEKLVTFQGKTLMLYNETYKA